MVIAALAVLNAFFLAFIIVDAVAEARGDRQAIENACHVLRNNGIEIDPDAIKAGGVIRTMRTARGDEAEAAIVRTFLGQASMSDQGVIYLYENTERGTAEFSSGGVFEILLYDGAVTNSGGALRTANRLLRSMKLETMDPIVSGVPGFETVTAVNAYKGASIFNCAVEFVFSGDNLVSVRGRYMTGIEALDGGAEISSAGTALLCFLAAVRRGEFECARIHSVEAGYQHSIAGPIGEGVIAPAWFITADSGQYLVDDASGEIRQLTVEG